MNEARRWVNKSRVRWDYFRWVIENLFYFVSFHCCDVDVNDSIEAGALPLSKFSLVFHFSPWTLFRPSFFSVGRGGIKMRTANGILPHSLEPCSCQGIIFHFPFSIFICYSTFYFYDSLMRALLSSERKVFIARAGKFHFFPFFHFDNSSRHFDSINGEIFPLFFRGDFSSQKFGENFGLGADCLSWMFMIVERAVN